MLTEQERICFSLKLIFGVVERYTGSMPNAYIAGGAIASLVLGETVNDYDFWFHMPEDFEAAANAIKAKYPFQESKYAVSFEVPFGATTIKIQLVQSRMGPPEVLTKKFDYKHTHSYYTRSGELVCDIDFIKTKQLVYIPGNFDHPVNTMQRMLKFQRRGYEVPTQTIIDLMKDTKEIKDQNIYYSGNHGGSC